ncbi:MAG: nitrate ABC transporter substrate-binding protein, partial [Deltaproteobacteria bacterium]|nr:nitrate ABC transporter substrate-binding protein [Deltaproteobacteria bacterium]
VTTQALFEKHPRIVHTFVSALLEGWRQALDPENQKKTLELLHQHDRETPADLIAKQLAATRTFVRPSPDIPIGYIDTVAWKQTEQIMLSQGLITKPVHIERALKPPTGKS